MISKLIDKIQKTDPNEIGNIDMEELIEEQGNFIGSFTRAIDFGGSTPSLAIINLLVSDGDSSRGQRESMFNPDVNLIGTATGKHKTYGNCTIILTCTKFNNKNGDDDTYQGGALPTLKSKISSGPGGPTPSKSVPDDEDMALPPGFKSIDKSEKIVVENGKKKKITKIIMHMEDGSTQTETNKETVDE